MHDWEGNTEEYLFEIDCIGPTEEGKYQGRELYISQYCLTIKIAIMDWLYNFRIL